MVERKGSSKLSEWLSSAVEDFRELASEDKIAALDGIIDACEAAELKYLSDRLEIFLKRDFVRFLPNELRIHLLSLLDPVSLGRCCLVSKTWNEAVSACQPAWLNACRSIGWRVDESITSGIYWKKTYQRALTRLKQLKDGSAFEVSALIGHTARVYTLRYDGRELLASGSDDRSVRLWDVSTGECLQVIQTHTCADLSFDEYFVYTASFDNTIGCWEWNSGDLVRSYRGHTGAVFSVSYDSERDLLISGSADKTVRLWQLSTAEPINMYHGHHEWVTKVILQKSHVDSLHHKPGDFVILSMDKIQIRIWLISKEVNCESLCELSATDNQGSQLLRRGIPSYPTRLNDTENPDHCFLHPQMMFDGYRIMCSSERGVLEWDFRDYTLTRVTPHPNDPTFLLGVGKTMFLAADTCENCLLIRMYNSGTEPQQPPYPCKKCYLTSRTQVQSPSPETVDYEVERDVGKPCCSRTLPGAEAMNLPDFSMKPEEPGGARVTPTDESVEDDAPNAPAINPEDELVNDINYNNIKVSKRTENPETGHNGPTGRHPPLEGGFLGRWDLPLCRWSKRGSNYVCGGQSWLDGFSDANHTGLVFAAALPDHSIYLLKWADC